jgi:hypothetical protein
MLITKIREFDREIGGETKCLYCAKRMIAPPAILVEKNNAVYHVECVMQIIYSVLKDLSGYGPELPETKKTPGTPTEPA